MPTRPFTTAMELENAEMALALAVAADEDHQWDELLAGFSDESADDEEIFLISLAIDPLGRSAKTRIGPLLYLGLLT